MRGQSCSQVPLSTSRKKEGPWGSTNERRWCWGARWWEIHSPGKQQPHVHVIRSATRRRVIQTNFFAVVVAFSAFELGGITKGVKRFNGYRMPQHGKMTARPQGQEPLWAPAQGLFTKREGYPSKWVNPSWRAKYSPGLQAKFHS